MAKHQTTRAIPIPIVAVAVLVLSSAFAVSAAAFTAAPSRDAGGAIVGGRTEVEDAKHNKEVQELGRFSVEEYNRRIASSGRKVNGGGGGRLRFAEVVEAQRQVVAGVKYYLKIRATTEKGGAARMFAAAVVVQPWKKQQPRRLVQFDPVGN